MEQYMCGEMSAVSEADEEVQKICDKIRPLVEMKFSTIFPEFTAIEHTKRTVRGYKRRIKVHVGDEMYLHVYILEEVSKALVLTGVDDGMSRDSPLAP